MRLHTSMAASALRTNRICGNALLSAYDAGFNGGLLVWWATGRRPLSRVVHGCDTKATNRQHGSFLAVDKLIIQFSWCFRSLSKPLLLHCSGLVPKHLLTKEKPLQWRKALEAFGALECLQPDAVPGTNRKEGRSRPRLKV